MLYLVLETIVKDNNIKNIGTHSVFNYFDNLIPATGYANRIVTRRMKEGFTSKSIRDSFNLISNEDQIRTLQIIGVEKEENYAKTTE